MQQESEKKLAEKVEAAVMKRDQFWNQKMAAQEEVHGEVLRAKVSTEFLITSKCLT